MIPNVADALNGFMQSLEVRLIKKTMVDGEMVETGQLPVVIRINGCLQPMPGRNLLVKPEGQRQWKWWELYTAEDIPLDSEVVDPYGVGLRVMQRGNWMAGYFKYELAEGPVP